MEGDANFTAGKLDAAILAYQEAVRVDPNNAQIWSKLARIQTYSSAFKITNDEKKTRLLDALDSANKAVELAPDDSTAHAILAFTLDWNADSSIYSDDLQQVQTYLANAEREALQALQIDSSNTLALAFYAEVLVRPTEMEPGRTVHQSGAPTQRRRSDGCAPRKCLSP